MDGAAEAMLNSQNFKITVLGAIVVTALEMLASTGIGAPLAAIIGFSMMMILLGIWLLLIVRNALILCGLVFGPTVFSGLVNKDLWKHTRQWVGVMVAIISVKYVIYTALALAIALTEGIPRKAVDLSFGQALGTLMMVLALLFIALFAPFQIGKFVPIFGDEMQAILSARGTFVDQAKTAYEQGKTSYDGLKDMDNPRLGGGGGSDSEGGGGEGLAAAAGPEAAIAAKAKQGGDEQREMYEDAAYKGLGGGQGQEGGSDQSSNALADSSSSDSSSGSSAGPGGAFTPAPSPPPPSPSPGSSGAPAPIPMPDQSSSEQE